MIRVGVVGVGKMGLSHLAIINALEGASVTAVCDPAGYLLDVINKYTGLNVYPDYTEMLASAELDAVIIATPSAFHVDMVRAALERGLHVFCEKPFTLNWNDAEQLAALAQERNLVNQVGYHYRFVGAFQETKRLLDANALGKVSHVLAEAYGPVVLKPKGSTWRTKRTQGGGCLYDYAAHPLNLLNWYFGQAEGASGAGGNASWDADNSEIFWSCYGFPVDDGTTGNRAFFVNQRGEIIQTKMTAATYNQTAGPEWNAALSGGSTMGDPLGLNNNAAVDGNTWTAVQ